jgi:hypothetical protein
MCVLTKRASPRFYASDIKLCQHAAAEPQGGFFDCSFFSWCTFTGKLLVPNKLQKTLLYFSNINISKYY